VNHFVSSIELICLAAEDLGSLLHQFTFVGGSTVGLLVTDPQGRSPRLTKDVDVVIQLSSRTDFYELEQKLRRLGFRNAPEGPIYRFFKEGLVVDVAPTDPDVIGFSNRWYEVTIQTAEARILPYGISINLITPACFLATKLEAFSSIHHRDHDDMLASGDFEDIVLLLDGRPSIVADVLAADAAVITYLRLRFETLLQEPYLDEAIEAHLDFDKFGRVALILERINGIVDGAPTTDRDRRLGAD